MGLTCFDHCHPGLECRSPDSAAPDVDELELALAVLERTDLVGLVETLANKTCHGVPPCFAHVGAVTSMAAAVMRCTGTPAAGTAQADRTLPRSVDRVDDVAPVAELLADRYELGERIGAGGMGTVYRPAIAASTATWR